MLKETARTEASGRLFHRWLTIFFFHGMIYSGLWLE